MKGGLLVLLAIAAGACGSKASKVTPPATVVVELVPARALWYAASPPSITGSAVVTPGLLIGLNNDSDGPGVDSNDNVVNGAADALQMTSLVIKKRAATAAAGDRMHVFKKPSAGNVRVFRKGESSAGILTTATSSSTADADATSIMNDLGAGDVELYVEGTAVGDVDLCTKWDGSATAEACVKLFVVDGYGAAAGYGPRIYGDTNRDRTLTATDLPGHDNYQPGAGTIVFTNLDRDCGAGANDQSDATIACAPDEADIAHFRVDKARLSTIPASWKAVLRYLSAGSNRFRVFNGVTTPAAEVATTAVTILGQGYRQADLATLPAWAGTTGELTLGLEGRELDVPADPAIDLFLCVTDVATQTDAACDKLSFRTNSALLQPNTQGDATVVVLQDAANADMRASMGANMPAPAVLREEAIASGDQWLQDEIEIAGIAAPRGNAQLVLQLPRAKGLGAWADSLPGLNVAAKNLRAVAGTGSGQFGGNIECSPPPAAGGFGSRIVGDSMEGTLVAELANIAPLQGIATLPVNWLGVGHVDEVAGVFSRPGGGWGTVVGDPDLARALLVAAPAQNALFWSCRTTPRTRAPECFGEGVTTTASVRAGATPARLTAAGFTFTRPAGREFQWLRIYAGRGRGQVARITVTSPHAVDVAAVARLPSVAWTRCAGGDRCDPSLTMPAATADFARDDWFELPDATSRFVVVEESLRWSNSIPAVVTAGELRDVAVNPEFWGANHTLVVQELTGPAATSVATVLAGLPGAAVPVRVPSLYSVFVAGGALVARRGAALLPNLTNFQVVNGAAGRVILAPKPWGPSNGGADPFETTFRTNLAGAGTIVFVDDWNLYHLGDGEVHCGTNLFKREAREWWH